MTIFTNFIKLSNKLTDCLAADVADVEFPSNYV